MSQDRIGASLDGDARRFPNRPSAARARPSSRRCRPSRRAGPARAATTTGPPAAVEVDAGAARRSAEGPRLLNAVTASRPRRARSALKRRLDQAARIARVRVADPRHVGVDVERRRRGGPVGSRHDHAELAGNQLRAEVVRMAASAGAARAGDARTTAAGRRRTGRARPSARRAGRRSRCIGPRSSCALPAAAAAPARADDLVVDRRKLRRGRRERTARTWRSRARSSVAVDGRSRSGVASPVSRFSGRAATPCPRTAHSWSHRCCLTSGISVCTASSMSAERGRRRRRAIAGPSAGLRRLP